MNSQTVHWLVLSVAVVVVTGTSITQYATFEDLDMHSPWPISHVGVLAKEKDRTTWVIHNRGNGTYSMIWDEYRSKWGLHRLKISEWMDSVNGTTIKGAVGAGGPNYDLLFDNCFNARDAMVGYFSGGIGSLYLSPIQTCSQNKRYCGHEPEAQAMEMTIGLISQREKILISCGHNNRISRIDICPGNCSDHGGKPRHARCECVLNQHYCGHQLAVLGGWGEDYNRDTLYLCLGGINFTTLHRCTNGCFATEKNSVCGGSCIPNGSYCGDNLKTFGWTGYDPQIVYQCDASGRSAHIIANCSEGCLQGPGNAMCLCHPGRDYCVHELYTQMNWLGTAELYASYPNQVGQCQPAGLFITFTLGIRCTNCIASQGEKDAYCEWIDGVLCGQRLNQMGFTGYDNDMLYQYSGEVGNASIISMCLSGTCQENKCSCIPLRTYCGYQLYLMGFLSINSENDQRELWQCDADGKGARITTLCNGRCINIKGRAKCACMDTELYCGYELLDADPPYDGNGVYQCSNEGTASLIKACKGSCIRASEVGVGMAVAAPACYGECVPGETYCGSKLLKIGLTGYDNNSIYTCSMDGRTVNGTGQVDILCTRCTDGRRYCGHQLTKIMYISENPLQTLFICERNGTYLKTTHCPVCLNNGVDAYCQCILGTQYCGRQIQAFGWQQFLETTNFTDDVLVRCVDKEKIEVVEQCPTQECRTIGDGISYCMCSPGRTYCGHQLDTHYNSPNTYLTTNRIYQCSDNQLVVNFIKECVTCVSVGGNPVCRQQCIHKSRYCGSDLLQLEGWDNLDSETLYQCTNGSFALSEMTCTQGCQGKNGDVDAYCLGMPMAWYWILMIVTLPLLFISLCIWLIRTIIKHRRLQKFVGQHRINASQLILVRKLGHGQFGEVWQSRYTDPSGQKMYVAVKISKHHLNTNPGQNLASANCFFQESVALDFLWHQNITRALGICSNLKMAGGITTPALVLEFMDGENSADYILKEREHLQTSDLMKIFTDICQAGEHLQKMGVIHRDIGARNVLIRKHPRNGKPAVAKLTDFGLAKDIGKNTTQYKSTNAMFHKGYTAPEGFRGEFSSQSDVWSFGVFMWELYMLMDMNQTEHVAPYSDIPSRDILIQIGNGHRLRRPLMASTEIYSTITSCWTWMPESRPTFRQLRKTLQTKRTRNGVESDMEMETHWVCHVGDDDEADQRKEEAPFLEQSFPKFGYVSPNANGDEFVG